MFPLKLPQKTPLLLAALLLVCPGSLLAAAFPQGKTSPEKVELLRISSPLTPSVDYGLERDKDGLLLVLSVEGFKPGATDVSVRVGVAGDHVLVMENKNAKILPASRDDSALLAFKIPAARLVDDPKGWEKLRLAFDVEWAGPLLGKPRLKQRFRHADAAAAHAGLSPDPRQWQPLDMAAWERRMQDRKLQIAIDFEQPMDGRATLVIEDVSGKRIRNLVSGAFFAKGQHRVFWDGMDENSVLQIPGDYRWRSISHPGIKPVYLMSFADAPGSNHGTFHAAATNGKQVVLGTQVSEGGHQVVVLEKDGTLIRGFNAPHGVGLGRIQVAADEKFVYAAYDGTGWGTGVDKSKNDWKAPKAITLVRFEIGTGNIADYPGKKRLPELLTYEVGPGSPGALPDTLALRGLVLFGGKLYLADALNNQVKVINPATADIERAFALEKPVALAAGKDALFAVTSDNRLLAIDPASGNSRKLAEVKGKPAGLALDADGNFYVSDQESHVIRVLVSGGKEVRIIGHPGGLVPGTYDPLKFQNPEGLVVADDLLWVTERQRWEPKRFAAFDIRTGEVKREFFGPTAYGSPGAGFDPLDETLWIGQGTLFKLDFDKKSATPLSILGGEDGRRHTFWRKDGRTFVISSGKITMIQELTVEGTLRSLALISSAHQFCFAHNWNPPEEFIEAFKRDYPNVKYLEGGPGGVQTVHPNHGFGMLWVDRNGDGKMQAEEIEFATAAENLGGSGWSQDFHDLTLRVLGTVSRKNVLVTLEPKGWWPGGAPKYPPLNDAIKVAVPIDMTGDTKATSAVDRFGNTVVNSSPMVALSPDGKLLWAYPNQWIDVHGSQKAPLPNTGELQGALFFSGMTPLDEKSDVFVMNGNHGRAFVMTTDGLYLDEMFTDVRLMTDPQAGGIGILGGECFGGTFGKSEKTGNYYFQGGGIEYRIYRVDGLKETIRQQGTVTVSAKQLAAAERNTLRTEAQKADAKEARAVRMAKAPTIDGNDGDWQGVEPVVWENRGKFPVQVRIGFDDANLYLFYKVWDESPWVNQGKDWQALFKTGDGVDLQLGTDEAADPKRTDPVPGDLRLFIAPSAEGDVAVLYRHRVPGANKDDGVVFQSPWRSEKVDVAKKLAAAKVAVVKGNREYTVEVDVPLAELGISNLDGKALRGDFGVIYGDGEGTMNLFRNYWSNRATGLVNDVPGEIMLTPNLWGGIRFGEKP